MKSPTKSLESSASGLIVKLEDHSYRVNITSHDNSGLCEFLATICNDKRPLIITNSVVGPLLTPDLLRGFRQHGLKAPYLILPDGERHKTLATVELCYNWLVEQGADRQSVLVLLGGGVLGDIGGMVAATFLRGIRYVQVPTTLVAQVDSSIGGKVGVDHKEGKNLIGAFYQPQYVHCDVAYLETLPEREYLSGLAEVIKYAIIKDPELFQFLQDQRVEILQRQDIALEHIVQTCCQIKADVVGQDEKEVSGERMILNFGHTVGHALEKLTDFSKYGHGEAVGIGMLAAAEISKQAGYCSEETARMITDIIAAYGLPVKRPRFAMKRWEQVLSRDKKMRGGSLQYVFVKAIGSVEVAAVTPKEIAQQL